MLDPAPPDLVPDVCQGKLEGGGRWVVVVVGDHTLIHPVPGGARPRGGAGRTAGEAGRAWLASLATAGARCRRKSRRSWRPTPAVSSPGTPGLPCHLPNHLRNAFLPGSHGRPSDLIREMKL